MPCSGSRDHEAAFLKAQVDEIIELLKIPREKIIGGASDAAAAQKKVRKNAIIQIYLIYLLDFK